MVQIWYLTLGYPRQRNPLTPPFETLHPIVAAAVAARGPGHDVPFLDAASGRAHLLSEDGTISKVVMTFT